jgi:hypothetical protein
MNEVMCGMGTNQNPGCRFARPATLAAKDKNGAQGWPYLIF